MWQYIMVSLGLVIGITALVIGWQYAVRKLADRGWFWVRTPFMKYLAIETDRILQRLLVACSGERWTEIENEYNKTKQDTDPPLERIEKGLVWIGPPWGEKNKVKEWYETQADELDPNVPPLHSVGLEEKVYEYLPLLEVPENASEEERARIALINATRVPTHQTADAIEAQSTLVVSEIVYNPMKALYNIVHRKTAILNKLLPIWREVVGGFNYFSYGKALETDVQKIIARQIIELSREFRVAIGISILEPIMNAPADAADCDKFRETRVTKPENLPEGKIAKEIYNRWGTFLTSAEVKDFDAADPAMRKKLEDMLSAVIDAQAALQEALGVKGAEITKSEALKDNPEAQMRLVLETLQGLGEKGNLILSIPEASEFLRTFAGKLGAFTSSK